MEAIMKKFFILSALVLSLFIFAGCGSDKEEKKDEPADTDTTDQDVIETNDEDAKKQCEDNEGRVYSEGDRISDKCLEAYCCDGEWCEDEVECDGCWGKEIGDKMEWTCADGVTKVDWCECVEDEAVGSTWNCIERADLTCQNE